MAGRESLGFGGGWKCGWEGERGNAEASSRDLLWQLIEGGVY